VGFQGVAHECIMQSSGHHFYSTALGYDTESGGVDGRSITNARLAYQSVTAPIFRPIPPPLVNARTIESGFAQLGIHLVMRYTKPRRERSTRADVRWPTLHARAEVFCAVGAWVELR
jgi:hypothetical protein